MVKTGSSRPFQTSVARWISDTRSLRSTESGGSAACAPGAASLLHGKEEHKR